jgi:hypothetical protein
MSPPYLHCSEKDDERGGGEKVKEEEEKMKKMKDKEGEKKEKKVTVYQVLTCILQKIVTLYQLTSF